ncbi:hypothetical protein WICMUC_001364 [Wickerhamomyces mucosus]|uniref:Large ribosomal subunit protein mL40 n=1 Tax=Wickerhamomyces mucosus TaxID=1378264 RepID=A0A9P8PVW6_9ASCO|nr:hypothetical protein WICMUC_001364 [Wickerhamomyces mucosus]
MNTINSKIPKFQSSIIQQIRGIRTKKSRVATVSTGTQRVITQLSVISGRKKYPRLLKLSNEDRIRHETINKAWSLYQKDLRNERNEQLELQYNSILNALNDLKQVDIELFKVANKKEKGKRFPIDLRIPVDFPANKVWHYEVKSNKK